MTVDEIDSNYIQNYVSNNYCFNYQNFRKSPVQNR